MTVELADLVASLEPHLNVPGAAQPMFDFTADDPWINALASAFWVAKNRGRSVRLWSDYRVNVDADAIVNTVNPAVDFDPEDQQIVVLQAALTTIEAVLLSLPSHVKNQAGPVSTEVDRSSTVLRQILENKHNELEMALKEVAGTNATRTYIVDAILQRSGYAYSGVGRFVN